MKPIEPKYNQKTKVEWRISQDSILIISNYAKYTGYDEDELIDLLIKDILVDDIEFKDWALKKRNNKKIASLVAKFEKNFELRGDVIFEEDEKVSD